MTMQDGQQQVQAPAVELRTPHEVKLALDRLEALPPIVRDALTNSERRLRNLVNRGS